MMRNKIFNDGYVSYWKERVETASDGCVVPGIGVISRYVRALPISPSCRVLDYGCGYGRAFPVLSSYSDHICGFDVSCEMLDAAKSMQYKCLVGGDTVMAPFPAGYFDVVFVWATFDALDQDEALVEFNRILRLGGTLLLTGKNYYYEHDDFLAFNAERIASVKKFPNSFTRIDTLLDCAHLLGYELLVLDRFKKRGDFGLDKCTVGPLQLFERFYEYVLVLKKVSEPAISSCVISSRFSDVSASRARLAGYEDTDMYLASLQ